MPVLLQKACLNLEAQERLQTSIASWCGVVEPVASQPFAMYQCPSAWLAAWHKLMLASAAPQTQRTGMISATKNWTDLGLVSPATAFLAQWHE